MDRYSKKPQYIFYDTVMTILMPIRFLLKFLTYPLTYFIIPAHWDSKYRNETSDHMKGQGEQLQGLQKSDTDKTAYDHKGDLYSKQLIPRDYFEKDIDKRRLVFVTFGNASSVSDQDFCLSSFYENLTELDTENSYAVIGIDPTGVNDGRYIFSQEKIVDGMYDFIKKRMDTLGFNSADSARHVAFVGQSLGGALLTCVAAKYHRHERNVKCITVASPRDLLAGAESVMGITALPTPIKFLLQCVVRPITSIFLLPFGYLDTNRAAADFKNPNDLKVFTVSGSTKGTRRDDIIHEDASMRHVSPESHTHISVINPTDDQPGKVAHNTPWPAIPATVDKAIIEMFNGEKSQASQLIYENGVEDKSTLTSDEISLHIQQSEKKMIEQHRKNQQMMSDMLKNDDDEQEAEDDPNAHLIKKRQ